MVQFRIHEPNDEPPRYVKILVKENNDLDFFLCKLLNKLF